MKIEREMSPELFIEALRVNAAVIIFPFKTALNKAVKHIGFYQQKSKLVQFQLYS